MKERLSTSAVWKLFSVRRTIEHSAFFIGLIAISLSGVFLLLMPARASLQSAADTRETISVTLAGAGTEGSEGASVLQEDYAQISAEESAQQDIMSSLIGSIEESSAQIQTGISLGSVQQEPIDAAATVGYQALRTVTDNQIMSYTDYSTLLQIVEAECTGGDETSKQYVANVVLNRTKDDHFPDTVYDVVWQRLYGHAQFSPTQDGRIGTLKISDSTVSAVNKAVAGEDISEGALFFVAKEYASRSNVEWFESELVYLYSYGGHDFYKFKDA